MLPPPFSLRNPASKTRSGAALVLVLAAMAVISFVLLAIMALIQAEDRGSQTSAELVQARMLSSLPEKLVISQIRRATGKPDDLNGLQYTWASQPGLISVFDNSTSGNSPRAETHRLFKLYSARKLVLEGNGQNDTVDGPLAEANEMLTWQNKLAQFVDLNEPVRVGTGQKSFITFPILDPRAQGLVDGFKVHSSTNASTGETPPVQAPDDMVNASLDQPKMAMPAAWMYVLQDGSIIAPNKGSQGGMAEFGGAGNGSAVPTAENPIVGRIAYWTDDDSCKLNVNTATEPSPWEAPHTHSPADDNYAATIPAKGEYYRNSGHPAYTSLAPVLRHFGQNGSNTSSDPDREPAKTQGDSTWKQHISDWHHWLPRTYDTTGENLGTEGGTQVPTNQVDLKQTRLFATVDELMYTATTPSGGSGRNVYQDDMPSLNPNDLSKVRFFLTAHSRAPELNLFNRPKVSLWPLMQSSGMRTDTDKKFALAASLADDVYYFQRQATWQNAGTLGSSQTGSLELASGTRNNQLFGYLQELTERDVPGFGGKFSDGGSGSGTKFSATARDQLLVSMFDFIRSGVNTSNSAQQIIHPQLKPAYDYLPPSTASQAGGTRAGEGGGTATPLRVDGSGEINPRDNNASPHVKGYGRFPTITEVAIVFVAVASQPVLGQQPPLDQRTTQVQAFVVVQPYMPNPGVLPASPHFMCRIYGLDSFKLGTSPSAGAGGVAQMHFASTVATSFTLSTAQSGNNGKPWGGEHSAFVGFSSQFLNNSGLPKRIQTSGAGNGGTPDEFADLFTAISPAVDLTTLPDLTATGGQKIKAGTPGSTLAFSGGNLEMEIVDPFGDTVQTLDLSFPPTDIPVPLMPPMPPGQSPLSGENSIKARFTVVADTAQNFSRVPLLFPGDVVRSMVLAGGGPPSYNPAPKYATLNVSGAINGDARMLAGRVRVQANNSGNPNEDYFVPHPNYFTGEGIQLTMPPNPATIDLGRNAQSLRDGAYMANANEAASDPQFGFSSVGNGGGQALPQTTADTSSQKLAIRYAEGGKQTLTYQNNCIPATPVTAIGALNADRHAGDFDTGPGLIEDGAYLNYPDAGNGTTQYAVEHSPDRPFGGYFQRGGYFEEENGATLSPWRQISSAIAFGSLPTGIYGWSGSGSNPPPRPWQTLLFCPNPPSRTTPAGTEPDFLNKQDHFGFLSPRDHLWLEYFWMPPVEPDGLAEGFSTEGKVNMNYQIAPYFWIKRATAMHGALHGVRLTAIPNADVANGNYKKRNPSQQNEYRYAVDPDKTLAAFDDRFYDPSSGKLDVFRSPSEICEMFLIPKQLPNRSYSQSVPNPDSFFSDSHTAYTDALKWWKGTGTNNGFDVTGDNLREAPYAQLYPRLCTKSNVFTVHYRVQVLRKSRSTKPGQWIEGRDKVAAEYRGQATIERYLDPDAQNPKDTNAQDSSTAATRQKFPDFATQIDVAESLDDYYKYRVMNRKRFSP